MYLANRELCIILTLCHKLYCRKMNRAGIYIYKFHTKCTHATICGIQKYQDELYFQPRSMEVQSLTAKKTYINVFVLIWSGRIKSFKIKFHIRMAWCNKFTVHLTFVSSYHTYISFLMSLMRPITNSVTQPRQYNNQSHIWLSISFTAKEKKKIIQNQENFSYYVVCWNTSSLSKSNV